MSALVFDIETVPLASSLAAEYPGDERPAPANYKDPAKIEAWHVDDKRKWEAERVKEYSLSPRLGRIVCAGFRTVDDRSVGQTVAESESDEAEALRFVWGEIGMSGGNIVTFNGLNFDVPFFLTRSLILGVSTSLVDTRTIRDWTRRYSYAPHYDLRAVLTGWDSRASGTLADWCKALGCYTEQKHSGADIYDLYKAGNFDAIAEHCRADVGDTKSLYHRVSAVYGECLAA